MNKQIIFGLDIGGTSTHGIRAERTGTGNNGTRGEESSPWSVVGESTAGSANLQNVPPATAEREIRHVLTELGAAALPGSTQVAVVAGSGGIDTPADEHRLRDMLTRAVPQAASHSEPNRVIVVHDSRLILAAGGQDTGISLIAGTGSVAWGRSHDGAEARSGGWGHLLGDEGSGWWIAREAIRRCLRRADSGDPVDALDRAVLSARSLDRPSHLIADFHSNLDRTTWAQLAVVVDHCARSGELAAQKLLHRAADELVELAAEVGGRLGVTGPVVIGGGLVTHSRIVREACLAHGKARGLTDLRVLETAPVTGALHLARSLP